MTILSIAQNIADNIPLDVPTVVMGSQEDTASIIRSQSQKSGLWLMKRKPWTVLVKEHVFSTVVSQENYALPADFDRMLDGTVWDRNNFFQMRGGLTPQEWQNIKSGILAQSIGIRKRFRMKPVSGIKEFFVDPVPSAVETLVFEYVSKNWTQSAGGAPQSLWVSDDDTGILDEYIIELGATWRVLNRLGMIYLEEKTEFEDKWRQAWADDRVSPTLSMNRDQQPVLISAECNVPDTGFGV